MRLYFAGAEVPSHRKVLREIGAKNVALSFIGLQRRIKKTGQWKVADHFPEGTNIFIDSGAYTVNQEGAEEKYSIADLRAISDAYQEFVANNIDTVEFASEFDALALGRDWIEQQREDFYDDIRDKFLPLWHPEWGVPYLQDLDRSYARVGVPVVALGGRNLVPVLNSLVSHLHGVAMTKVDEMYGVRWDSVSSTSWISPQRYGDTIVWNGRELKRYPKKYKDQARKRYRTLFEREGFDHVKIEADDPTEVLRLSAWSWEKLVEDIERKHGEVTNPSVPVSADNAESPGEGVDNLPAESRKPITTRPSSKTLPILSVTSHRETVDGEEVDKEKVNVRSSSQRICDTCHIASQCPEYQPGSNCAFNIPLVLRTKQDFIDMHNGLIEIQTQRVMFARFAEELSGGYPDPNLSAEMDRLNKMMKAKHEMEQEGWNITINARGQGQGSGGPGMLDRMFGSGASSKAQELPAPEPADRYVDDILEGEVVGEHRRG